MTAPPPNPLIFHITLVDNLPAIIERGELLSDRAMMALGGPTTAVGMRKIKLRRLHEIKVTCHPGKMVGDFVPFYFCARSVMLYLLLRSNPGNPRSARAGRGRRSHPRV